MADPITINTEEPLDDFNQKVDSTTNETLTQIGALSTPPATEYISPTTSSTQAGVKSASEYMTPATSVASQLNTLLGSDSEYMKQAAAKSKLTANELGMLSSDRYIGAAQGAAIREALPIATADAATATKFAQQQQVGDTQIAATKIEGEVSGALKAQEAGIQTQLKKTQSAIDAILASGTAKTNAEMAGLNVQLNTASQEALKNLDNLLNTSLMAEEYSQKTKENTRAQAVSQIENTMISIENTLKDPDILQLGTEAMSKMINNQLALMRGGVELTYNLAGLNIDSYVSDLLDTFETTYQWT